MIIIVIHSARPTGAPRIGLELALFLHRRGEDVVLFSVENGPITDEARKFGLRVQVLAKELDYADADAVVSTCYNSMRGYSPRLILCNSLATSHWAVAGKKLGAKVLLVAHELHGEMTALIGHGRLLRDVGLCADGLVVATERIVTDFARVVGVLPPRVFELGIFVDAGRVVERSREVCAASWPTGRAFDKTRPVVGMCGLGGRRKGFDRFVSLARRVPDYDFLWVGDLGDSDSNQLTALLSGSPAIENLFVTGWVSNSAYFIRAFDVFVLTSREDPNPLSALEASVLGVPLIVFTDTGETWKSLNSRCYSFYGAYEENAAEGAVRSVIRSGIRYTEPIPAHLTSSTALGRFADFLGELNKFAPSTGNMPAIRDTARA